VALSIPGLDPRLPLPSRERVGERGVTHLDAGVLYQFRPAGALGGQERTELFRLDGEDFGVGEYTPGQRPSYFFSWVPSFSL